MDNTNPQEAPATTMATLVDALERMRDAFTSASLMLQDLQFESDRSQRHAVEQASQELLNRVKPD